MYCDYHPADKVSVQKRFWSKVNKTRCCWLWTARILPNGYGQFTMVIEGKKEWVYAHRVSWYLEHGVWPNLYILHKCDVNSCVKPSHLFSGTQSNNIQDMLRKERGRYQRGKTLSCCNRKLEGVN